MKTTDGGDTWTYITVPTNRTINGIHFLDANNGTAVGNYGTILTTTDGGQSWSTQISGTNRALYGVDFYDENNGYAAGQISTILKTTDGGENWTNLSGNFSTSFSDVFCISENDVILTGSGGKILRTTDGGQNWIQQLSRTTTNLNGVCFIDSSIGYVTGSGGTILKTVNGGFITDIEENPKTIFEQPISFLLYQNYPNPFNPSTTIMYEIPEGSFVTIKVYDVLGNEIATLVNEEKLAGSYEVEFSAKGGSASGGNASSLASGIYFYTLSAGNFFSTKKMILLR